MEPVCAPNGWLMAAFCLCVFWAGVVFGLILAGLSGRGRA
ncbi:hypothetical protein DFW101_3552 [Solidesulfovibrio carbinoliphilus subsp. oakridgensis]|uniref:Uncharacterized protein n=1 Tax=Solidesulfovibrio carbinoliphilus subsp. oakridgensis TaxID=694327 RepID=G7QCA2_9BACT|nr:hypothetical protein DFW101_3552 [Solidesulfovibrio carbinoliphilus subsp. oakridgensis]